MLSVKIHDEYCISSARLLEWLLEPHPQYIRMSPDQLEFL